MLDVMLEVLLEIEVARAVLRDAISAWGALGSVEVELLDATTPDLGRKGHVTRRDSIATTAAEGSSTGGARKRDVRVTVTSRVSANSPEFPRETPQPLAP